MNTKIIALLAILLVACGALTLVTSDGSDADSIDCSQFAGEYYYLNENGSYQKGIVIKANGQGEAYNFYGSNGKLTETPTTNTFTITSVADSGTNYKLTANRSPDFNATFTVPKDTSDGSYSLEINHKSLVGSDNSSYVIQKFWKDTTSDVQISPNLGFTPENLAAAINASKVAYDDVTITIGDGNHYIPYNNISISINSMTIQAAPGTNPVLNCFTTSSYISDSSLTLRGLTIVDDSRINNIVSIQYYSNVTMEKCTVSGLTVVQGGKGADTGTYTFRDNTFTNVIANRHVVTASQDNIVFSKNVVDSDGRGINLQNVNGIAVVEDNEFRKVITADQAAIQISDNIEGGSFVLRNNSISNAPAAVAIHDGCTGNPVGIQMTGNSIVGCTYGVLFKANNDGSIADQVQVVAEKNFFSTDGRTGTAMAVGTLGTDSIKGLVQEEAYYVNSKMDTTNKDVISWIEEDSDEWIPQIPVASDKTNDDTETDTKSVVACAAAAVVAALMAAFLVLDRKGN